MGMSVIIVGAGIIGATLALRLARAGADVTVVDSGDADATSASFGWINASFYHDAAHFRLRAAGIAAWHRLASEVPDLPLRWTGAFWWEGQSPELQAMADALSARDYPVEHWDRARVAAAVPCLRQVPDEALWFPSEGMIETGAVAVLLAAAGVRVVRGVRVTAVTTQGGRATGVATDAGEIEADHVVLACGTGVPAVVSDLGLSLSLLSRPGLMLRTPPVSSRIGPVLVTPEGEIRQDTSGAILMPTTINHQADAAEAITDDPRDIADAGFARLNGVLDTGCVSWDRVTLGWRPVPQDGLPAIGPMGPDRLYVSVMHSGMTLAAIAAELATREILTGERDPLIAPYHPSRFA